MRVHVPRHVGGVSQLKESIQTSARNPSLNKYHLCCHRAVHSLAGQVWLYVLVPESP